MKIELTEKKITFKELPVGAIFKFKSYEGEIEKEDLYMKILVCYITMDEHEDRYQALCLDNAQTYNIDPEMEVTEFKNSSIRIEVTY